MGESWMLLYEAYAQIGFSIASLFYHCSLPNVMILSPILFKERLTAAKIVGFMAVLCGIFLINGNFSSRIDIFCVICGLFSAVAYSVMVIANKKSAIIRGLENSLIQLCVSFLTVAVCWCLEPLPEEKIGLKADFENLFQKMVGKASLRQPFYSAFFSGGMTAVIASIAHSIIESSGS